MCSKELQQTKREYREAARRTGRCSRAAPIRDCSGTLFCDCKPLTKERSYVRLAFSLVGKTEPEPLTPLLLHFFAQSSLAP